MNGLSAVVVLAQRPLLPLRWLIPACPGTGASPLAQRQRFAINRPPLPSLAESRHAMISGTS